MLQITVRFYAELNDFLPPAQRGKEFQVFIEPHRTIRNILTNYNIPTDQIDLVLHNGSSAAFDAELHEGDHVSYYPVFESFDISDICTLRSSPLRIPRFICDVHLGKLASLLRMLGFDTSYKADATDIELLNSSLDERRALLSKDRELLHHESLQRGYKVHSCQPRQQLIEIMTRFDLCEMINPFCRCICCNMLLESIPKEDIVHRLPPRVQEYYQEFYYCRQCDHVYWKGSHYERMNEYIENLIREIKETTNPSSPPT